MKYLVLLLSLLTVLLSCKKDTSNNTQSGNDGLWPLKVGNQWTYNLITYKKDGSTKSSTTENLKIKDTITVNGNTYFFLKGVIQLFLRNRDKNTVEASDDGSNFFTMFKKSHESNVFAYTLQRQGCTASYTYKIYSGKTKVNGYNCIRSEEEFAGCSQNTWYKVVYYLSSGIGLVKKELYRKKENTTDIYLSSSLELKSYRLK